MYEVCFQYTDKKGNEKIIIANEYHDDALVIDLTNHNYIDVSSYYMEEDFIFEDVDFSEEFQAKDWFIDGLIKEIDEMLEDDYWDNECYVLKIKELLEQRRR